MIVVSDSSPIINLAVIGNLHLLPQLYGRVIIPQAVYNEVVVYGAGQAGSLELPQANWVEIITVSDRLLVQSFEVNLDTGEAEALALALQLQADLLLVDEKKGRRIAHNMGVPVIGLLGVLVNAKEQALISEMKPILDNLMNQAGFWISSQLYTHVLQTVGEVP
ncbi:MAG: DUF3368 domain-containing protein [Anaerolineales bacterium]|nr:DUF3368 domain-containing protein [Anaerolineales bacterium]